jgi:capsid protein
MKRLIFSRLTAREIAAGLEALTSDLSQVNYSSIRAGLVEWRRKCEALQHGVLALQALRPIYRRFRHEAHCEPRLGVGLESGRGERAAKNLGRDGL